MRAVGRPSVFWHLASGTIGVWLGVHALRAFMAMVTWNVAEDASTTRMGLVAFGIYAIGLIGWLPTRWFGGARPAWRFGVALAVTAFLRQALPGETLSPVLSFASVILWLWWLPAFLAEFARQGAVRLIAPAVFLGLAAQSAGQVAMHGLDLPMFVSAWSIGVAGLLSVAFLGALWHSGQSGLPEEGSQDGAESGAAWGALSLFLFLFVELTLPVNLGRVQMLSGWSMGASAALVQASLLGGLMVTTWAPGHINRVVVGGVAVLALVPILLSLPGAAWTLIPLQASLALLLAAGFGPGSAGIRAGRVYGTTVVGALFMMVLLFLYYSRYGWPTLWLVAVAGMALLGLRASQLPAAPGLKASAGLVVLALAGIGLGAIPYSAVRPSDGPAPAQLKVYQYNVHQGFDTFSVPAVEAIGRTIQAADADIITLQEVNRGWNLSAGVDMAGWLQWRFPGYRMVYGPMNGELWGNVILTKYPVMEWGIRHFPTGKSDFPRGLVWADIKAEGGNLRVISTHYSAYAGYDPERIAQSEDLLAFWNGRGRTILAGDFNAHQTDQAVLTILQKGLQEVTQKAGIWEAFSYPAVGSVERLDYIFFSPDLTATSAQLPESTASDHLPVSAGLVVQ